MTEPDKITETEGRYLLSVARKTIQERLLGEGGGEWIEASSSARLQERRGTFVTLTIKGRLRGCIGHIIPQEPVVEGIRVNAINAAFRDPRFRPLSRDELEKVKIEISILTEPKLLEYSGWEDILRKLRPGVDGVILKKDFHQSTFLPQVWEQLPKKEEFLRHLCMKAGLDENAWKRGGLTILTYQVQAFEEE